jgi:hypothetical protein
MTAPGHRDPLALERILPAHEHQPSTRTECAGEVAEAGLGVLEEHRPEPADHRIERRRIEGVHLRVRLQQLDVVETSSKDTLVGGLEHA